MDRWIADTQPTERFPIFTRGNADEVGPDPFTPLNWSLPWEQGVVPGTAWGWIHLGTFKEHEFLWTQPETYGSWGGYFYNQVSVGRVFGHRMPGLTADAIDVSFFGQNPAVPKYVEDPRDNDEECSAALGATFAGILGNSQQPMLDEFVAQVQAWVASRPDLASVSDAELVEYGRAMAKRQNRTWDVYAQVVVGATVGPAIVQGIADAVGKPELGITIFAALGEVASAGVPERIWELSRIVNGSPELVAAFDAGVGGLHERLAGAPGASDFNTTFAALIDDFGHRGVNEWELSADTWKINPTLAYDMIDRVRRQDDSMSPTIRSAQAMASRIAAEAELTAMVAGNDESAGMLAAGINSGQASYRMREAGKNAAVKLFHEPKLAFRELGRRMHERGSIADPMDIFMLLDPALDGFLADQSGWSPTLAQRSVDFATLKELDPPYVVMHGQPIPPISEWPKKGVASGAAEPVGTAIKAVAGSPGKVTARTRIITDLSHADELEPGEILVCMTTDPSWVPLFMIASAVICEIGAPGSHAVIVSREIGVPCVVSLLGASHKLPTGTLVELDGSTGTVTVVESA